MWRIKSLAYTPKAAGFHPRCDALEFGSIERLWRRQAHHAPGCADAEAIAPKAPRGRYWNRHSPRFMPCWVDQRSVQSLHKSPDGRCRCRKRMPCSRSGSQGGQHCFGQGSAKARLGVSARCIHGGQPSSPGGASQAQLHAGHEGLGWSLVDQVSGPMNSCVAPPGSSATRCRSKTFVVQRSGETHRDLRRIRRPKTEGWRETARPALAAGDPHSPGLPRREESAGLSPKRRAQLIEVANAEVWIQARPRRAPKRTEAASRPSGPPRE